MDVIKLGIVVLASTFPAQPFLAAMPGDSNKPLSKTIPFAQSVQLLIRPHKHVLCKVLGVGKVAGIIVTDSPNQRCVTVVQFLIGHFVTGQYSLNQSFITWCRQIRALKILTFSVNIVTRKDDLSTGILKFFVLRVSVEFVGRLFGLLVT